MKSGVVVDLDIALLFMIAFAGGIIAISGFVVMLGRRISEPKREWQDKIDQLEEEIRKLKQQK